MARKPIPAPQAIHSQQADIAELYPLPFMLADQPRLFLNMLANFSHIPERYRNLISNWLHAYNAEMGGYILDHYGDVAAEHANLIASAQYQRFLEQIQAGREAADEELFTGLEESFKADDHP